MSLTNKRNLDKFKGCLIGGAIGDALGYPVEFYSLDEIYSEYGGNGIRDYKLINGKALISDDTQMTLFTANGLLYSKANKIGLGLSVARILYLVRTVPGLSISPIYMCAVRPVIRVFPR